MDDLYKKEIIGRVVTENDLMISKRELCPKLNIDQQIEYMKNTSGIKFTIVSEDEAKKFLSDHTYYFKVKAYAKNYSKYDHGENIGKYCNLEFAYLQELSKIDMHLRKYILKMVLDIEHFLKVQMLKNCANNSAEDGYSIVDRFLKSYPYIIDNIKKKAENSSCKNLIESKCDNFALWNIVEVLSFGEFINIYELYYRCYPDENSMKNKLIPIKFLRNAAAHNNCLINQLNNKYSHEFHINNEVNTYISKIDKISSGVRQKKMSNNIVHDFIVMLYVFNHIVSSSSVKNSSMKELQKLFSTRFTANKDYFKDNLLITTNYDFVKIIIDHFVSLCDII